MSVVRYVRAGKDASRVALWTVTSGQEDPGYLATNFTGFDVTAPGKLTSTSGIWMADLSASSAYQTLVGVALIHSNLTPGLEVRLQGSTTSAFSVVGFNQLITIPALSDNWPINPYVLFTSAQTFAYWRLNVVGSNPVPVSIGHIVLAAEVLPLHRVQQGLAWHDEIPTWDDVTEISVPQNLDLLTRVRSVTFDTSDLKTQEPILHSWWMDARGINLPFLFIPDLNVNECYWTTFVEKFKDVTYVFDTPTSGNRTWQIKLKEFGRGMLPTPWLT